MNIATWDRELLKGILELLPGLGVPDVCRIQLERSAAALGGLLLPLANPMVLAESGHHRVVVILDGCRQRDCAVSPRIDDPPCESPVEAYIIEARCGLAPQTR